MRSIDEGSSNSTTINQNPIQNGNTYQTSIVLNTKHMFIIAFDFDYLIWIFAFFYLKFELARRSQNFDDIFLFLIKS